jgi:dihydroorotase
MNNKPKFYLNKKLENKATHFVNAIICDPETGYEGKGELLVENGVITEFSKNKISKLPKNIEIINCDGNYLCPGIIDAQVHTGEPAGNYKEKLEDTSKAAIAGGVTTINIMPNTNPPIDTTAMVEFIKNRAAEKSYCNVTIFGAATNGLEGQNLSEMGLMKKAGVKGFTDANNYIQDSGVFRKICQYASNFDMLIAQTPLDNFLAKNGIINEGKISTSLGIAGIPAIAEKIALQRDLSIIEEVDNKYHAFNITLKDSVEILREAKAKKLKITASTTPHHISLTEIEAENFRTFAKINPPLKTEIDRKALIKGLKDGVIDFIASKHSAKSEDQKRLPIQSAEFGVVGLETLFAVTFTELSNNDFKLSEILKLLCLNPAKFLNLKDKGKICNGAIADLMLVDIKKSYILTRESLTGKAVNTAFDGKKLKGKILKTFVSGKLVYENK